MPRRREVAPSSVAVTLEALQKAKVVSLDVPLSTVAEQLRGLPELAGSYAIAWDKYVLVVGREEVASVAIDPRAFAIDPPTVARSE